MKEKLSVSNIAWRKDETEEALAILKKYRISNLEIAPTLLVDDVRGVKESDVEEVKKSYNKRGFNFVAMQSLLYGGPEYTIFDKEEGVTQLLEYLEKVVRIANLLGIRNLVFGSPKNRVIKDKENKKNESKAVYFFKKLGSISDKNKVNICLEANPKEYGSDFATDTFQVMEFVKKIRSPRLKLNLDTGTILMNGHDFEKVMAKAKGLIGHIHISAPYTGEIIGGDIDHGYISKLIKDFDYNGFISLELKGNITDSNLKTLERNLRIFVKYYGKS